MKNEQENKKADTSLAFCSVPQQPRLIRVTNTVCIRHFWSARFSLYVSESKGITWYRYYI